MLRVWLSFALAAGENPTKPSKQVFLPAANNVQANDGENPLLLCNAVPLNFTVGLSDAPSNTVKVQFAYMGDAQACKITFTPAALTFTSVGKLTQTVSVTSK